jgi:hypothetical protein
MESQFKIYRAQKRAGSLKANQHGTVAFLQ